MAALRALAVFLLAFALPARAQTPVEEAQIAELERLRAQVADEIHLAAFDLVDELIWMWASDPIFEKPTPVVLANVSVPVGLGTGMQALVENHVSAVLSENPTTNVQLVHCPNCTAVVVHSGPEGTVVSRGYDNPKALEQLGVDTGQHALFLDIEAEGSWLVLRARLTRLTPDLPIVWSHTLASSTSSPAMLRQPEDLKSAAEARKEYLDAMHARGPISIPLRFAVRSYADPFGEEVVPPPPMIWVQTGVEIGATDARAWTSSLVVGYSFIPQAYQGLMGQARVNRLVTGRTRSLSRPDLYLFLGGTVMTVWGPATVSFLDEIPSADDLLTLQLEQGPRTSLGGMQIGADLRIGNRIGFSTFIETLPSMNQNQNFGSYIRLLGIPFQTWGNEVTLWF